MDKKEKSKVNKNKPKQNKNKLNSRRERILNKPKLNRELALLNKYLDSRRLTQHDRVILCREYANFMFADSIRQYVYSSYEEVQENDN